MAPRSKKEDAAEPVVAKRGKPAVPAADEFDDLSALAGATKALEDERRAESGGSGTWMRLLNTGADEITKGTTKHIKGAEAGDYYIAEKNLLLKEPEMTVLGVFKVFAEKKPGKKKDQGADRDEMDTTVSFWHPVDAEQIPLKAGDNFRRELRNGNYLQPMHWMFVYIHDHPELKDVLIPFQSIGNGYCNDIMKIIKKTSAISTEIRFKFSSVGERNEEWNKTYFYPVATEAGRNFHFNTDTGKLELIPKTGLKADEVREILTRAKEAQENYASFKSVSKRSEPQLLAAAGPAQAALPAGGARKGLPGAKGAYEDDDGEGPTRF